MASVHQPLLPSDRRRDARHSPASYAATARRETRHYLTSKSGHYSVLLLVTLDVGSIFAGLLLELLTCDGRVTPEDGGKAQEILGIVSLVFSCLFVLELCLSVWSFGWKFFGSWFHCLDAAVILAAFIIEVLLRGVLEEVGSLVVVLRLWRVLKIIEELSAGAKEEMEPLQERLLDLEKENGELRREIERLKQLQTVSANV